MAPQPAATGCCWPARRGRRGHRRRRARRTRRGPPIRGRRAAGRPSPRPCASPRGPRTRPAATRPAPRSRPQRGMARRRLWPGDAAAGGMPAGIPPTPKLLAQVEALPPGRRRARRRSRPRRAPPEPRFTLRTLLRAVPRRAGRSGSILDGLDALAQRWRCPRWSGGGIDNGVDARGVPRRSSLVSLIGLAIVLADWVVNIGADHGHRAQRRAAAVHAAGQDLRPPAAARARLLRARAGRPDHDPDDDRRRRAVLVPADRPGHRGQLVLSFFGVLVALLVINLRLGLTVLAILPVLVVATVLFRGQVVEGLQRGQGAGQRRSTPTCRRTWPGCGSPRPTAARSATRARFAGAAAAAYRRVPAARPALHRAVLPVRPVAVHGRRRPWCSWSRRGQVHSGALTAGALIAFLLYIDLFFAPVQQLSQVFDGYQQAAGRAAPDPGAAARPRPRTPPAAEPPGRPDGRAARVELRDVPFRYAGGAPGRGPRAST